MSTKTTLLLTNFIVTSLDPIRVKFPVQKLEFGSWVLWHWLAISPIASMPLLAKWLLSLSVSELAALADDELLLTLVALCSQLLQGDPLWSSLLATLLDAFACISLLNSVAVPLTSLTSLRFPMPSQMSII